MQKAFVFLAPGFEEIEALTPVDVLRRGGVDVTVVSIVADSLVVEAAHGVKVCADKLFADIDFSGADALVLPGGMPGAQNLYNHEGLRRLLVAHNEREGLIAAICAAPGVVLGQMGLLSGLRATCYPGFEGMMEGATYSGEACVADGNFITAEGPGAALPFAYKILESMLGTSVSVDVQCAMRYTLLK